MINRADLVDAINNLLTQNLGRPTHKGAEAVVAWMECNGLYDAGLALQCLASMGQAAEAHAAQLLAEAERDTLRAQLAEMMHRRDGTSKHQKG
jgi:hypothetical protein